MELALEAIQGLVENRGFFAKELEHLLAHLVVVFECLHYLEGLVYVDFKSLDLLLMHLDLLFDRHFTLVEPSY